LSTAISKIKQRVVSSSPSHGAEQLGKKALEMNFAVCPRVTLFPGRKHGVPVAQGGEVLYPITMLCRYTLSTNSQNAEE
jgi:hypothetical protein